MGYQKVDAVAALRSIEKQVKREQIPAVTVISRQRDPFLVLVSCILSLRTKDATTDEAAARLFKVARTPQQMLRVSVSRISKLIYPVGFYRNKAKFIGALSRRLVEEFGGIVPHTCEELLSFKGVGRKTANLVLGLGFNIPAICVDTHVHRISNRIGWVRTRLPFETETALQEVFPARYWIRLNTALVSFGQHVCAPVSPFCNRCMVRRVCLRRGVTRSR